MKKSLVFLASLLLCLSGGSGCKDSIIVIDDSPAVIEEEEEKIFIVDRTNKKWDITHAVTSYGFEPSQFQIGLGPNAIKPIIGPDFVGPDDRRYPKDTEDFLLMGASLRGESRAYPIVVMTQHEIVDDVFLDVHVAVAY